MYCCDTNKMEAVLKGKGKLRHVPDLTEDDAHELGKAVRAVRTVGAGNGELCVPIIGGLFDKIKIAFTAYRNKHSLPA